VEKGLQLRHASGFQLIQTILLWFYFMAGSELQLLYLKDDLKENRWILFFWWTT